jgi:YHS domain-containing protein
MRILIALGLALIFGSGCARPADRWESRGDRVLGIGSDHAEDPVTGAIVEKKDAVKQEYRGALYYFATPESAAVFALHPAEYAIPEEGQEGLMDRYNAR